MLILMVLSLILNLILGINLNDARGLASHMSALYEAENLKVAFWRERALSQERQHKESLNRELQYRLALDNIVNMNHGDPAYSIWVRQYASTILSRTKG